VRAAAAAVSLEQSGVTGAEKALAGMLRFLMLVL
jgi:hypothetical protein